MKNRKNVKVTVDMFEDTKMKIIDTKKNRDVIHYIWFRSVLLAGKVNRAGELYYSSTKPYTLETLSIEFNRPVEDVKSALEVLIELEMICITKEGAYKVKNFAKHQNIKEENKQCDNTEKACDNNAQNSEEVHSNGEINEDNNENKEQSSLNKVDKSEQPVENNVKDVDNVKVISLDNIDDSSLGSENTVKKKKSKKNIKKIIKEEPVEIDEVYGFIDEDEFQADEVYEMLIDVT